MTGLPIWGNLNRATNDPTLIDEAIAEAIVAHEEDPDAHLGVDESLQSHRASEIIDHLAESVVNDKIKANTRAYVAIVDPSSDVDFDTIQSATEYARGIGGGTILIMPGVHYTSEPIVIDQRIGYYAIDRDTTTIDASGATGPAFYLKPSGQIYLIGYNSVTRTNGSNLVTLSQREPIAQRDVVGMSIINSSDANIGQGYITAVNSPTELQMSTNQTGSATTGNGYFAPNLTLTNGSATVAILYGQTVEKLGLTKGGRFRINGSTTVYTISDILSSTSFTISAAYSGTTGTYPARYLGVNDGNITLENIQLIENNSQLFSMGVWLTSQAQEIVVVLQNCILRDNDFYFTDAGISLFIDQCKCYVLSGIVEESQNLVRIINTDVYATANGSGLGAFLGPLYMSQVNCYANSYTSHFWVVATDGGGSIEGCLFESTRQVTITGTGFRFTGSRIVNSSTYFLEIVGSYIVVTGCSLGRVTIQSGSVRVTVTANSILVTPTNSGTNSLVTGNNVGT